MSIDDFGTGFSSLSRQAYLPVTEVKIDKSFIDQFTHDRRVNALVEAVVHIGHNLDMVVVAEGVESISQWNCLKHMGCPVIQGYLFLAHYRQALSPTGSDHSGKKWNSRGYIINCCKKTGANGLLTIFGHFLGGGPFGKVTFTECEALYLRCC
ncbi:EAL domain-containing protein [Klebsiella pneumoniae subsp. pneumoniae]|nr:EAL domain-containing protein [Klebsiella pneumoniae subsp. pneumoniae]